MVQIESKIVAVVSGALGGGKRFSAYASYSLALIANTTTLECERKGSLIVFPFFLFLIQKLPIQKT